jgi:hypothetical protein
MDLDVAMTPRSIRAGWRATLATPVVFVGAALVMVVVGRWSEGVELAGWRPGVTIRGTDRVIWAPVGDRFLGGVSERRLAETRSWAFAP